jgi:hypothetical protein
MCKRPGYSESVARRAAVLHPMPPQPTMRSAIKFDPQRSALQLGVVREGIQSSGDVQRLAAGLRSDQAVVKKPVEVTPEKEPPTLFVAT